MARWNLVSAVLSIILVETMNRSSPATAKVRTGTGTPSRQLTVRLRLDCALAPNPRHPALYYNCNMEGSEVKTFGLADSGYFALRLVSGRSIPLIICDQNYLPSFVFIDRATDASVAQVYVR